MRKILSGCLASQGSRTRGFRVVLISGEEKLKRGKREEKLLETDDVKLFKDLLTNKMFSKRILSWNSKMELCLNSEMVWKFLGWKLVILTTFFVISQSAE